MPFYLLNHIIIFTYSNYPSYANSQLCKLRKCFYLPIAITISQTRQLHELLSVMKWRPFFYFSRCWSSSWSAVRCYKIYWPCEVIKLTNWSCRLVCLLPFTGNKRCRVHRNSQLRQSLRWENDWLRPGLDSRKERKYFLVNQNWNGWKFSHSSDSPINK